MALEFLRNALRKNKSPGEYLLYPLAAAYKDIGDPPAPWWKRRFSNPTKSLQQVAADFRQISNDPRVQGVILEIPQLQMSYATIQSLKDLVESLQTSNKQVITWAKNYDLASYYLASSAHKILMQPGGQINALGLTQSYLFLANALREQGLSFDAIMISPFKSAADMLTRESMSPQARQMADWLADSLYLQITEAIAKGRGLSNERVKKLIDESPYTHSQAKELGLIDSLVNQEGIPHLLGNKATVVSWEQARKVLYLTAKPKQKRYIALVRIEGDIVDGKSQRPLFRPPFSIPFLLRQRAGDLSIVQNIRKAAQDQKAVGVLLYINSGGGSATASEAIHSAIVHLAKEKPVVALMGPVAASGGYYVACPVNHIVAQAATLTGSIGVLMGKFVSQGFFAKHHIGRETISRGENALFFSAFGPFTDQQRERARETIEATYRLFLERVAQGRKLTVDAVDSVGKGRVWTGKQALDHGLIDQIGGLPEALERLKTQAELTTLPQLREVTGVKRNLAPANLQLDVSSYLLNGVRQVNGSPVLLLTPLQLEE